MAANPEQSEAIGIEELRAFEGSVLKALCLTINTAGSELKYKILDSLSEDDFYFPLNRAVFLTLAELHRRGEYVISANLDEELQKTGEDIPAGFLIEELFSGTLPGLSELNGWVVRLKERSRAGMVPTVKTPKSEPAVDPLEEKADATQVRSVKDVKKKIAQEHLRNSSPAVEPPEVSSPGRDIEDIEIPFDTSELSSPAVTPPPPKKVKKKVNKVVKAVLASEGDDWSDYMDDLASSQGKTFDTGFARLDEGLGGLNPGLMLLVDEDRVRLFNFMKQITDQFASGGELRCLYVASELPKSALRLRTLSRLAGVSLQELEKGRVKKDSSDWKRIEAEGRQASSWLKRVFVYEAEDELELTLVQELVKKLLDADADSSCLVVIDSLEKVARESGAGKVVSQLKSLADRLDVLILAATTDPTLLASRDADLAAVFRESSSSGGGGVELEVLQAGNESSTVVTFSYEPDFCRFVEQ
ncbi:MAG: hypothetical protein BMS9Abin37_1249 [Acidobacteriota bacterium]|nr:MAG: hypothetical protein BMS9Abin37_1249 [Acidobacteriota bacterium]